MKNITTMFLLFASAFAFAQDDLLSDLEAETADQKTYELPAFKAMKICNLQSTKVASKKELYFFVSHRFGSLHDGLNTFFGLDNANTKIQLVYGIVDGFQVGLSRESLGKSFAGSTKIKIVSQSNKFPLTLSGFSTVTYNTAISAVQYPNFKDVDRLSYATQLLAARRFNRNLSLELAPSFIRHNTVFESGQDHNQFALGAGGRYKISTRTSINAEYVYNFNRVNGSAFKNPLTIGVDLETGGHVFQLMLSNAQSNNEPAFISHGEGDWTTGEIFFGFNIVRVF